MNALNKDAMEELLWLASEKATAGAWRMEDAATVIATDPQHNEGVAIAQCQGENAEWNSRYIAAASPEVVAHLIERLSRLERLAEAAVFLVKAEADGSPTGAFKDGINWVIQEAKSLS